MIYRGDVETLITAKKIKGVGNALLRRIVTKDTSLTDIISKLNESKIEEVPSIDEFSDIKYRVKERLRDKDGVAIAFYDDMFPTIKGGIADSEKPLFFICRGNIELLTDKYKRCAVIGTRETNLNVVETERKVVRELVERDICVVSGLAIGCDETAHREVIKRNGKTIAVLPSTVWDIYPKNNTKLAEEIVEKGGLLVSEYFTDQLSGVEQKKRFVERDRLQAMLSDAIILAGASEKNCEGKQSGSRLAMNYAKNYQTYRTVVLSNKTIEENDCYSLGRLIAKDKRVGVIYDEYIPNGIDALCRVIDFEYRYRGDGLFGRM